MVSEVANKSFDNKNDKNEEILKNINNEIENIIRKNRAIIFR